MWTLNTINDRESRENVKSINKQYWFTSNMRHWNATIKVARNACRLNMTSLPMTGIMPYGYNFWYWFYTKEFNWCMNLDWSNDRNYMLVINSHVPAGYFFYMTWRAPISFGKVIFLWFFYLCWLQRDGCVNDEPCRQLKESTTSTNLNITPWIECNIDDRITEETKETEC
jgi:hypothetical protein